MHILIYVVTNISNTTTILYQIITFLPQFVTFKMLHHTLSFSSSTEIREGQYDFIQNPFKQSIFLINIKRRFTPAGTTETSITSLIENRLYYI